MIDKQYMIDNGFTLKTYPDGNFWVLLSNIDPEDVFIQADEALVHFTLCDFGWVDDLTEEEFKECVQEIINGKEVN